MRAIVIDDEPFRAELTTLILRSHGHRVIGCLGPRDAVVGETDSWQSQERWPARGAGGGMAHLQGDPFTFFPTAFFAAALATKRPVKAERPLLLATDLPPPLCVLTSVDLLRPDATGSPASLP